MNFFSLTLGLGATLGLYRVSRQRAGQWLDAALLVLFRSLLGARLGFAAERLAYFYFEESCGQCTPCREGTGWLYRIIHRIEHGQGRQEDLDLLLNLADQIQGRTICALGDAAAMPTRAFVKNYREEFEYHVANKRCMVAAGGYSTPVVHAPMAMAAE